MVSSAASRAVAPTKRSDRKPPACSRFNMARRFLRRVNQPTPSTHVHTRTAAEAGCADGWLSGVTLQTFPTLPPHTYQHAVRQQRHTVALAQLRKEQLRTAVNDAVLHLRSGGTCGAAGLGGTSVRSRRLFVFFVAQRYDTAMTS
eukprot:216227-Chlamydomonas_euryale.AAC.3